MHADAAIHAIIRPPNDTILCDEQHITRCSSSFVQQIQCDNAGQHRVERNYCARQRQKHQHVWSLFKCVSQRNSLESLRAIRERECEKPQSRLSCIAASIYRDFVSSHGSRMRAEYTPVEGCRQAQNGYWKHRSVQRNSVNTSPERDWAAFTQRISCDRIHSNKQHTKNLLNNSSQRPDSPFPLWLRRNSRPNIAQIHSGHITTVAA